MSPWAFFATTTKIEIESIYRDRPDPGKKISRVFGTTQELYK